MSYLNWKEMPVQLNALVHSETKTELVLTLERDQLFSLVAHLEAVYLEEKGDLRLQLPQNWLLFWKRRDDGSRALLAHPEKEEWVGTFALEASMGKKLLDSLRSLSGGKPLKLSDQGLLISFSNLELTISLNE